MLSWQPSVVSCSAAVCGWTKIVRLHSVGVSSFGGPVAAAPLCWLLLRVGPAYAAERLLAVFPCLFLL